MTENPQKKFHTISGLLLAAFYLAFAFIDGPVWAKDSASYTGMSISREPVYPLFLAFFRTVFGEAEGRNGLPAYLFPAVIVQALVNIALPCTRGMRSISAASGLIWSIALPSGRL